MEINIGDIYRIELGFHLWEYYVTMFIIGSEQIDIYESNNNDVGDLINIRWGLQWTKFQLHIYIYIHIRIAT